MINRYYVGPLNAKAHSHSFARYELCGGSTYIDHGVFISGAGMCVLAAPEQIPFSPSGEYNENVNLN